MGNTNPYRRVKRSAPTGRSASRRASAPVPEGRSRRGLRARPKHRFASRQDEALYDSDGTFNPQGFDYNKTKAAIGGLGHNRRMFDRQGHINAIDKRDALTQIHHLLNEVTKKNAIKYDPVDEPRMSKEARRDILAAALKDDEGFRVVGQELAEPIKAILDYEGFARKIFRVRNLAQAELFRIPKDVRSIAYVIMGDGMTPEARLNTKYIFPPEYKITSFPTVDISDIYRLNFDILDRAQDTSRQEIELQEDKAAINLIDTAAQAVNTVTTFSTLGIAAFEAVRYQVERHRLIVSNFLISRAEVSDIVTTMSTAVDPVSERELILAGYIGSILNAQILTAAGQGVEEVIPAGTFYATTDPDYLGEMGVRITLQSAPFNKFGFGETVKGWAHYEEVGYGIPNSRAVAKGEK